MLQLSTPAPAAIAALPAATHAPRSLKIEAAIGKLDGWLRRNDYRGYDPFDGLNAWLRPVAFGRLGRQLLQQGVRRCPWNLRPLLGIKPSHSSKGFGFLARAYLKLHQRTGQEDYLRQARMCLSWLQAHGTRQFGGIAWGNHFDYQSRVFYLPRGTPTIVWVAHITHAFIDAWHATNDESYLRTAVDACTFIVDGLERRAEGKGVCISYIPGQFRSVHNANVLGAAVLARLYAITGEQRLADVARGAIDYTVGAQLPNGAWWYGEAANMHWVDNFHTGYVLDSLWWYISSTNDKRHQGAFERGAEYFIDNFFLPDGTPKYYAQKTAPIDIQCASQAIESLCLLSQTRHDPALKVLAQRVAEWTIANMQDKTGYFHFRKLRFMSNKAPTLHWGQATMMHALASLMPEENRA